MAGAATSRLPLLAAGMLAAGVAGSIWLVLLDNLQAPPAPVNDLVPHTGESPPPLAKPALALDTANQPESESERRTVPPTPGDDSTPPFVRTREDIAEDWHFLDDLRSKLTREAFAAAQGIASDREFMTLTIAAKLHATMAQCLLEGSYLEAADASAAVPDPERLILECRLLHIERLSIRDNALLSLVRPAPRILVDLREHRDLAHNLRELPRHQSPEKAESTRSLQDIADELLDVGYRVAGALDCGGR